MKKILLIVGVILGILVLISVISIAVNPEAQESFDSGMEQGKQTLEQN